MAESSILPINVGILGCAGIAKKFSRAINLIPDATLAAVGSRSHEKAAHFAATNNFPLTAKVLNSYEAVLNDPDIDAVYIPLPTSLHLKYAVLDWEDGKVATIHCSFLENLTMDVTVIGTKGTLHMNDFVVPYDENKASFYTATGTVLNGLETGWMAKPSNHTVITDLPQECLMVREFSRLVSNIKNNGAELRI